MTTGGRWITTGLAALAGVALQLQQAALWPRERYGALLGAAALVGAVVAWRARRGGRIPALGLVLALAAAGAGGGWAGWRAAPLVGEGVAQALMGPTIELTGTVAELPRQHPDGFSFVFDVERAMLDGRAVAVPRRVMLGWHRGLHEGELRAGPPRDLVAGQRWQLAVRLGPPVGLMNPHGFDLELWLFEQGIRGVGQVRARVDGGAVFLGASWRHPVERLRGVVRRALFERVPDARAAGVLAGLALGDQPSIDTRDWDTFRRTGIAHLLAVSGLHITMFAWGAAWAVRGAWRRSVRALRRVDAQTAGRWGGLALATAYAVFSGWGVPAQRTVVMLAVVTVLKGRTCAWPWPLIWLASAVAVVAVGPWALLQAGFWLSFAAVGLLMLSSPAREVPKSIDANTTRWTRLRDWTWEGARTQLRAALGLAPLAALFFNQVSLVGFGANLLAIPWVTAVCTPLALLGIVLPPAWSLGALSVQGMTAALQAASAWPAAVWPVAAAPAWVHAGALSGAALAMSAAPRRLRVWALPLCVPLLAPALAPVPTGDMDVLAVDVGQGTAVMVRTAGHTLLFDSGPQYSPDTDAGSRVLVPLLQALGVSRIDELLLSHSDLDHVGGAAAVLKGLPILALRSSLPSDHALHAQVPVSRPCLDGQRWVWDGVRFEVLHPAPRDLERAQAGYLKPNGVSCVLRVVAANGRAVLITGDIEFEQEWALVRRQGEALRSDVLLVPHHGSTTSSTAEFLQAVRPSLALIQTGWRNRYGHPAPSVLERYRALGIPVLTSPACGAWQWRSAAMTATGPGGECVRRLRQRYWHTRLDPDSPGGLTLLVHGGTEAVHP